MEQQPMNIHQRMLAVMRDVAYVQKADKKVNNQYSFVTHDAVTAKVRAAFVQHGIVSTVSVERHQQDGNRTEVDVQVDFVNADDPKDRVTIRAFGYGIDPQDKGPGKAVSYAVKYAYLKAFALETGDDPERDNIDHKTGEVTKPNGAGYEKHTARQACVDELENMAPEQQTFIREQAMEIMGRFERKQNCYEWIEAQHYDNEEKMALWALLPSNVRSTIKTEQKQAQTPALATQP